MKLSRFFRHPWLELLVMMTVAVFSFIGLSIISFLSQAPGAGEMGNAAITLWLLAFFLISFSLAVVSVIAGIGGGVIFVPVMMAFTPINSVIIRASGLIVTMFSALMSTGLFVKKGIANFKMCLMLTVSQGLGVLLGAKSAIAVAGAFGESGEGIIRIILGCILAAVAAFFFKGGKKLEWPNIQNVDALTKWMKLEHTYYEESDGKVYTYKITRILLGLALLFWFGLLGGFFGMGAGWAITPVQNLGLGVPLKTALANSNVILGMASCMGVWPFMLAGGIIPLFALPWLSGQVAGGYLGALVLVKVKVTVVRFILIGIMMFTSFSLITDGFAKLDLIPRVPGGVSMIVFLLMMAFVVFLLFRSRRKNEEDVQQ
ncbi:MAG: sulfite exporter TauE/SafE family protein [Treponema sp.]|nr:sulfite exporter TauE/SafE family protein [Treponema sp.]